MNKDETMVKDFPEIFEAVKNRKNVILLGDNIEDVAMIDGFEYENVEGNLELYKNNFDVIVINDGSFEFINNLILVCSKQIV